MHSEPKRSGSADQATKLLSQVAQGEDRLGCGVGAPAQQGRRLKLGTQARQPPAASRARPGTQAATTRSPARQAGHNRGEGAQAAALHHQRQHRALGR